MITRVQIRRLIIAITMISGVVVPAVPDQREYLKEFFCKGSVRFVPELAIGDDAMGGKSFFSQISDIAMDDHGNIYACDSGENNIKKFDSSGSFLGIIGRPGQGPGEFSYPMEVEISRGRLLVRELMNLRVSIINLQGAFLKSIRIKLEEGQWWSMRALPDGRLVVQREKIDPRELNAPQEVTIDLFSSDLEFIKTLYRHEVRTNRFILDPIRTNIPVPFAPQVHFDLTPDGKVVIGYSGKYEIEIHDPDQGRIAAFSHSYTPVKITAKDKELHFKGITTSVYDSAGVISEKKGAPDYIVNNTEFPRHKPPFGGIRVDAEGNIWVLPYRPAVHKGPQEMDVFDKEMRFLGRVQIESGGGFPYRMVPLPSGFWTIRVTENGEWNLVKIRISE